LGAVDRPDTVLSADDDNFTDTQFVTTARARRMYRYRLAVIVEHRCPLWEKRTTHPLKGEAAI
jgi:hypothetical protein